MTKPARGRPPHAPELSRNRILRARVTAEQLATFNSRGGAVWLRGYLNSLAADLNYLAAASNYLAAALVGKRKDKR